MDVEDGGRQADEGIEVIPSMITRRKRSSVPAIDVTDTQAYKDLYANNLRMYGFLLQKEMDRKRNNYLKKLEGEYFQNHVINVNAHRNNRLLTSFRKMKHEKKQYSSALDLSPSSDSKHSEFDAGSVDSLHVDKLQVNTSNEGITDENGHLILPSSSSSTVSDRLNVDMEVKSREQESRLRPRARTTEILPSEEVKAKDEESRLRPRARTTEEDEDHDETLLNIKTDYIKSHLEREDSQRRTRLFAGLQNTKKSTKCTTAFEIGRHTEVSSSEDSDTFASVDVENNNLMAADSTSTSKPASESGYLSDGKHNKISKNRPLVNKRMKEAQDRIKNRYARMRSLEGHISKADKVMKEMKSSLASHKVVRS